MKKKQQNRVILLTGNGKGKTSSALGMVLRAIGHDLSVSVIQFVKGCTDTGEARTLKQLPGVEHLLCGKGFVTPQDTPEKHQQHCRSAAEGITLALARIKDPKIHMIVLDEICSAINLGLLAEKEVLQLISEASEGKIIILTGRNAPQSLIDLADTVSEIQEVKHGMRQNIPAQPGVEF